MIVRDSKTEDIPAIIGLLQSSLGETFLKKTEATWCYKHFTNPFGVSPVLVAEADGILIGVRAFMQWRWQIDNVVWTSYRAVDTATHPNYQGKGIFKKLTLQGLDLIQRKGECFVFNTPNAQSRPGYLKMGWQEVGKIKVALVPVFLYRFAVFFTRKRSPKAITLIQLDALCEIHNRHLISKQVLFTPKSAAYLKWRYEENPLQDYFVFSTPDCYVAMYVKKKRFFKELRVVETIGAFELQNNTAIRQAIVAFAVQNRCWVITLANSDLFRFGFYGAFGPKLTFKPLTSSEPFIKKALTIENWFYTLGDLELF